jgi:NAD(P)-dependent dehydrogenase (short-subunit alcohol dehydrogenase family)
VTRSRAPGTGSPGLSVPGAHTGHPVACTADTWALRGPAEAACLGLGPRGTRVDTVHPGCTQTPTTAHGGVTSTSDAVAASTT